MNIQPKDMNAIYARIEALERQNRRLNQVAVSVLLLVTTGILCAFPIEGQTPRAHSLTATEQTLSMSNPGSVPAVEDTPVCSKDKITLPASWPLDAFPKFNLRDASPMSLTKSEVVPDFPTFSQIVSKVPTLRDKLSLLACMAESLQAQVNNLSGKKADFDSMMRLTGAYDRQFDALQRQFDGLAALHDSFVDKTVNEALELKRELEDYKAAVCPVLRTARMNETTRMKLDSACGLR